ncbi:MAG: TIM barrel protein [Thermoplasmata archaeon]
MIRFGPSGIPLSCKGRTLKDGIEDVHALGLTALEVQLVRVNVNERYVREEEIGLTPRETSGELIVEVLRKTGRKEQAITDLGVKLRKGDIIASLSSGLAKDYIELEALGELAKELDIELTMHTPYYMDLAGGGDLTRRSMDSIKWAGLMAHQMGAGIVVTHVGLYGELTPRQTMNRVVKNLTELRDWFRKKKVRAKIGVETSGRQEVFGSLKEVLKLCERVKGILPILNFSHIHSREGGSLRKKEDFQKVIEAAEPYTRKHYHTHFSGVEHEGGNELRYTPIKRGDLRFEPLADAILDSGLDITVISSSPLLEHDAMYMKVILERVLSKRVARAGKEKKEGGK